MKCKAYFNGSNIQSVKKPDIISSHNQIEDSSTKKQGNDGEQERKRQRYVDNDKSDKNHAIFKIPSVYSNRMQAIRVPIVSEGKDADSIVKKVDLREFYFPASDKKTWLCVVPSSPSAYIASSPPDLTL